LTFFTDADLAGQALADAITESSGGVVEMHDKHFPQRTDDVDWLRFVGQRDWVVITKDKRIRKRPLEREALINAGVRAFVLVSGNLKKDAMAAIFRAAMPAILELIAIQPPPFIARVSLLARVDLLYPRKDP
jgi:hypothetical protein